MRYPSGDAVLPVLECADMIRRGVIVRDINSNGAVLNYVGDSMSPTSDYHQIHSEHHHRPSLKGIKPALNHVRTKVHDQFSSIKSAVGRGLNDLVESFAPLIEGEEQPTDANNHSPTNSTPSVASLNSPPPVKQHHQHQHQQHHKDKDPLASLIPKKKETTAYAFEEGEATLPPVPPPHMKVPDNIDPLLGTENIVERPKKQLTTGPESTSSSLNGFGKSYANLPGDPPDLDPLLTKGINSTPGKKKSGKSLFSPNWFPSSSASSSKPEPEKGSRLSAGVDLNVLHSYQESVNNNNNGGGDSHATIAVAPPSAKKSKNGSITKIHQQEAVSDRLLDLADELIRISQQCAAVNNNNAQEENPNHQSSPANDQNDALMATAKRLQALVDVLGGLSSVVDYDVKFGNRSIPTENLIHRGSSENLNLGDSYDIGDAVN
jgi:hypothetical protein